MVGGKEELPGGFGGLIVSFPESALFFLSSETGSGSSFFGLLLFKESLLRGEFGLSLFEVGGGSSMSGGEHLTGLLEVIDESEESSLRSLLVGGVFDEGSLEGLEETLHFVNDDSESVTINSRSDFHERSNWVRFTNLGQLSESSGGGLWTKGLESWDNHLKSLNSLFSFRTSGSESGGISSPISSDLGLMSRN